MILKPGFLPRDNDATLIKIVDVLVSSNLRRLKEELVRRPFYFYPNSECEYIFEDEEKEYLVTGIIVEPVVRRRIFTPLFLSKKGALEFERNGDIWISQIKVRFTRSKAMFEKWYEEYLKASLAAYKLADSWEVSDEGER